MQEKEKKKNEKFDHRAYELKEGGVKMHSDVIVLPGDDVSHDDMKGIKAKGAAERAGFRLKYHPKAYLPHPKVLEAGKITFVYAETITPNKIPVENLKDPGLDQWLRRKSGPHVDVRHRERFRPRPRDQRSDLLCCDVPLVPCLREPKVRPFKDVLAHSDQIANRACTLTSDRTEHEQVVWAEVAYAGYLELLDRDDRSSIRAVTGKELA